MKAYILSGVIGLALGIALAKYYMKPGIQMQEVIKDRVVTVTKQVKSPDGTVTTDVVRTENRAQNITVSKSESKQPTWLLTGGMSFTPANRTYSVQIQRQVLGPVYMGIAAERNQTEDRVLGLITVSF